MKLGIFVSHETNFVNNAAYAGKGTFEFDFMKNIQFPKNSLFSLF